MHCRSVSRIFFVFFFLQIVFADKDSVIHQNYYNQNSHNGKIPVKQNHQQRQRQFTQSSRSPKAIPLDMIMKLNNIENEKQLFEEFIEDYPSQISTSFSQERQNSKVDNGAIVRVSRVTDARQLSIRDAEIEAPQIALAYPLSGASLTHSHGRSSESAGTVTEAPSTTISFKSAICLPENRTVSLRDTNDPTLYYYPSCIRINRCGGCCSTDLLSCQPTAHLYHNISIIVTKYHGGKKLEYKGKKIMTVEQHTKCRCQCKIKAKDCTPLQEYIETGCRCVCVNKDEEMKCSEDKFKLWDPSSCTCRCRENQECSTGYYFDQSSCSCIPNRKQFNPSYNIDQTRYGIDISSYEK